MKTHKHILRNTLFFSLTCLLLQTGSATAEPVYSLRGLVDVDEESEMIPNRRSMAVDGGIEVNYEDQPPVVPHNIDKDRISLQENTCLKCHSKADSKLENTPKPTPSHFKGRDGEKKAEVVPNRYFCTQCHMPQANIKPLIKNNFTD